MATTGSTKEKIQHLKQLIADNQTGRATEFLEQWEAEIDADVVRPVVKKWAAMMAERKQLNPQIVDWAGRPLVDWAGRPISLPKFGPENKYVSTMKPIGRWDGVDLEKGFYVPHRSPPERVHQSPIRPMVKEAAKRPAVVQPVATNADEVEIVAVVPPPVVAKPPAKGKEKVAKKVEVASGSERAAGPSGMAKKPKGKEPITPAAPVRSSARIKEQSAKKQEEEEKKGKRP